ncbi:MAG TPA: gamma-glutamyltransferase [Rubrobacteraceae bacterium]|nr:gamma-glutamyltransferase [Rubrobacteraceae bacterium]
MPLPGDPFFSPAPDLDFNILKGRQRGYVRNMRRWVYNETLIRRGYKKPFWFDLLAVSNHTPHFVVADRERNVVSATQSLGSIFGSKTMPEGTGIWLNDAIAWLRFKPAAGNVFGVSPGHQSLYALCPMLVISEGRPWIAIGTPGGRTITQTTPQMLIDMIDFGMDVQQAVTAPRVSYSAPNTLMVETGIPRPVRTGLSALGHNVQVDERGLGNAHGLTIDYDSESKPVRFMGDADPRDEGAALGY